MLKNSEQTPLGRHIIRAKIGAGLPKYAILKDRRFTGAVWSPTEDCYYGDFILSRVMWLSGTEIGKNRLGNVDTMQREIYIHGTHDEKNLGTPNSHGCIRMGNQDIIELFDWANIGTKVEIKE